MSWTPEQRGQLIAAYWSNAAALRCPCCQQALRVAFHSTATYAIDVRCPAGCDATTLGPDDDLLRGNFRPWTAAEERGIVDNYLARETPTCPVCGNGVFVSSTPRGSGDLVSAQCGRCSNTASKHVPRSGP